VDVKDAGRSLRTLLFAPESFFEEHAPEQTIGTAIIVVLAVTLITTIGFALIGWLFAANIDATVTVTTMEPWSNSTCASFRSINQNTNMSTIPEPCTIDKPRTKQVDIGDKVWDAFVGRLPVFFVASVIGWILIAAGLHIVSALTGGEGAFTATLSVAGWAMVLQVLQTVFGVASIYLMIESTDFATNPELLQQQMEQLRHSSGGILGTLVVTIWQGYIWTHGLRYARNLQYSSAALTAGVIALIALLFSLV
jgi:hypothetical protein